MEKAAAFFPKRMQQTVRMCFRWKKHGGEAKQQAALHSGVCATAPWQFHWLLQAISAVCGGRGGGGVGGLRPPTVRKFSIIPQICQIHPLIHVTISVTRCYSLRIQEGCQVAQKLRCLEVYHFCNIFKHTGRAMRSSLQTRALAIQKKRASRQLASLIVIND